MKNQHPLRGLATISLFAADHAAATRWYSELLGVEPYFKRLPGYVEFRIGDYQHELGIIDAKYAPYLDTSGTRPSGVIAFWHVDDVDATLERLLAMGAKQLEGRVAREAGFITASVVDPFGNILGIMYNPHYREILQARRDAAPSEPGA